MGRWVGMTKDDIEDDIETRLLRERLEDEFLGHFETDDEDDVYDGLEAPKLPDRSSRDKPLIILYQTCNISDAIVQSLNLDPGRNRPAFEKLVRALHCVVTDLVNNVRRRNRGLEHGTGLYFSKKPKSYTAPKTGLSPAKMARWIGYRPLLRAIDILGKEGWLTETPGAWGWVNSDGDRSKGLRTLLKPTPHLEELVGAATKIAIGAVELPIHSPITITTMDICRAADDFLEDDDLGRVTMTKGRRDDKHRIEIPDEFAEKVRQISSVVAGFNKVQIAHSWTLDIQGLSTDFSDLGTVDLDKRLLIVSPVRVIVHRAFCDGSLERGGRYYCALISMVSRPYRRQLRISGQPLVELDFKSLHPRIAYNLEGERAPDDCYYLGDEHEVIPRSVRKAVVLIMLNMKSGQGIDRAVRNQWEIILRKDQQQRDYNSMMGLPNKEEELPQEIPGDWIATVLNAARIKHAPIRDKYLMNDWGTKFQFLDSEIATRIVVRFTELKAPIMILHDGFLTTEQYANELRAQMVKAYKEVVKTEFEPAIDRK